MASKHLESEIIGQGDKKHGIPGEFITIRHKMYDDKIFGKPSNEKLNLESNILNGNNNEKIKPINIKIGEDKNNLEEYPNDFSEKDPIDFTYPKNKKPFMFNTI